MRAAVMEAIRQPLVVRDVPDPTPPSHGVVVRVEANGICRSDWHLWSGDWSWFGIAVALPHVLGHEFCGVVEAVGREVTRWRKGDGCSCPSARARGRASGAGAAITTSATRSWRPGWSRGAATAGSPPSSYADVNLVPLPERIGFVEAASMGCRYMTSFHGVVDRAQVQAGEWVAVHGCGGVGLSAVQIATALRRQCDRRRRVRRQARLREGARSGRNRQRREDGSGRRHRRADQGRRAGLDRRARHRGHLPELHHVAPQAGRHLQIGLTTAAEKGEVAVPIDILVMKEASIVGSLGMPAPRFGAMLQMVETGRLAPGKLVHRRVPARRSGCGARVDGPLRHGRRHGHRPVLTARRFGPRTRRPLALPRSRARARRPGGGAGDRRARLQDALDPRGDRP